MADVYSSNNVTSHEYESINVKQKKSYLIIKRAMDIVLSTIALIVLTPLFLVVAIIIKIDSPGPVLFNQLRAGKNSKPILMYKFRSMCKDADEMLKKMDAFKEHGASNIKQRLKKDPRITKIGRIIRTTSIDELPQLCNVLIGNMSLVGPRPLPIREHDALNIYQQQRTLVKPGLTCYWQVSGRSTLNEEERVMLDCKYIQEQGIKTDIVLLLKTIPALITAKGAY